MKFDDRLATAMRIGASGPAMSRIELRQLLDLLGASPAHARSPAVEAAYARITELAQGIPPVDRAAIVREPGLRLRSARLVALLGASEDAVAEAAVARAQLTPEEWQDLIPAISPAARRALRQRDDLAPQVLRRLNAAGAYDRGLPPARVDAVSFEPELAVTIRGEPATVPPPHPAPLTVETDPGTIGALVRRIEAYRQARQAATRITLDGSADAPRLPLGEDHDPALHGDPTVFDFSTGPNGAITWADGQAASMLVGLAPFTTAPLSMAFNQRRPITAQPLDLSGTAIVGGDWQIDAAARFAPQTGAFLGYAGRMRRIIGDDPVAVPAQDSEADRIRQLLHELRTPVNAIQGFAEVIQQQLFGPTPHEYRALAANIASDAARMLAAFEELERLARLESGALDLDPGSTDFVAVLRSVASQLHERTAQRKVAFAIPDALPAALIGLPESEAELLGWRLLATLGGAAMPGETLKVGVHALTDADGALQLTIDLPASLRDKPAEAVLHAAVGAVPQALAAGMFGVGFALRLARAELRAAGGALKLEQGKLLLHLPDLTRRDAGHSAQHTT